MRYAILRPCRSIAAYECIPKRRMRINLAESGKKLQEYGYEVHNSGVFLTAVKSCETTVYSSGRLLIRTESCETAERAAEEIYSILSGMRARTKQRRRRSVS